MTETRAIVIAIDGDHAVVRTEEGGCGRCHEQGGCGGVNVARALCGNPRDWRVLNPRGAIVGESVSVAIESGAVSSSASLIYALPLLLLIAGSVIGTRIAEEPGAIGGAVCGLVASWFLVRWINARRHCDSRFQPHIL